MTPPSAGTVEEALHRIRLKLATIRAVSLSPPDDQTAQLIQEAVAVDAGACLQDIEALDRLPTEILNRDLAQLDRLVLHPRTASRRAR